MKRRPPEPYGSIQEGPSPTPDVLGEPQAAWEPQAARLVCEKVPQALCYTYEMPLCLSQPDLLCVFQLCLTLCDPMVYTVHGILQARILEWVAFPFSRGSSQPTIEPRSLTLQGDSLPAEPPGKPSIIKMFYFKINVLLKSFFP